MSKLRARLSDPAKSGVYRTRHERDILDALKGCAHGVASISLGAGKEGMISSIARALGFPKWFGENWDALEDCLTDLSWREGEGQVLLFSQATPGDDLGILVDVLGSAGEFWRETKQPFFAVFVDPEGKLPLPVLYKEKAA